MTNKAMGRSQMNECPHKTVSRFYDSLEAKLWRCDWCGAEFRAVEGESNMVELTEVGTTGAPADFQGGIPQDNKPIRKKDKSFAS